MLLSRGNQQPSRLPLAGFAEEMDARVLPGDQRSHRCPDAQHAGGRREV